MPDCFMPRSSLALLTVLAVFLTGCLEGERTGPEDIHWDRDIGQLCNMMISDPRYVAEIRGGTKRRLFKFDDVGCAINWLNEKPWAGDEKTEIWVAERTSTREHVTWLDARTARFVHGEMTPMNYGFAAVNASVPGSMDFVEMTNRILKESPNHICRTPGQE